MPWPERSSIQLGLGLCHPGTSPSEVFAQKELAERTGRALACLRAADREVIWLRHYDELSFAEVGTVVGTTENAATVRYVRAIARLKKVWEGLHGEGRSDSDVVDHGDRYRVIARNRPCRVNSSANFLVLLHVHRNGDSGSPRVHWFNQLLQTAHERWIRALIRVSRTASKGMRGVSSRSIWCEVILAATGVCLG